MPGLSDSDFERLLAGLHQQLNGQPRPVLPQWVAGEADPAQAAREAASARMLQSVRPQGGRQEGFLTLAPQALAMSPLIWSQMLKELYGRATTQAGQ